MRHDVASQGIQAVHEQMGLFLAAGS